MYQPPFVGVDPVRVTLFFEDPGSRLGFSESYYPMSIADVNTATIPAFRLMNARVNLCAVGCFAQAVRISLESVQRDGFLFAPGPFTFQKETKFLATNVRQDDNEMPYSTVLVREQSTSTYHAQRYLSGIPDDAISDPPGPNLVGAFGQFWAAWQDELQGRGQGKLLSPGWGFAAISKVAADRVSQRVLSCNLVANTLSIRVPVVQVAVGDVVKIYGANWAGKQTGQGYLLVTAVDPLIGSVTAQVPLGWTAAWQAGGRLERLRRIIVPFTSYQIRGETHHKRGGRFFLPRGRSRNRT